MKQPALAPGTWRSYHFILASTSPRRRGFLEILGIPFTVVSPGSGAGSREIDETPLPGEGPADLVQRLSRAKAQTVLSNLSSLLPSTDNSEAYRLNIVIAADTVVVLENKILGKPNNPAEAVQMLKLLRQQPHYVYSGLTVAYFPQEQQFDSREIENPKSKIQNQITRLHQSKVWMRPYTDAEIAAYVAGGSSLDKAGAYGIQDQPFSPVERLEGCYAGVMGLPLGELVVAVREVDLSLSEISSLCTRHTGYPCCLAANQQ